MVGTDPLLQLENVCIATTQSPSRSLVHDLSLSVCKRCVTGLIGESGSGKTLTSRAIAGLLSPGVQITSGTIRIEGLDVTDWDKQTKLRRGRDIGFIFQNPMSMLNPVLKIKEQMIEGVLFHQRLGKSAAIALASEFLNKVGLGEKHKQILNSYPHTLSGGMLQRVMIAMTLMPGPKFIVADEPTTALDVTSQLKVLNVLAALKQEFNLTILFVSHDLSVISNFCDDVFVMQEGSIVESGAVDKVFSQPAKDYTQNLLRAHELTTY
ncbi:ABC transporter ATP-binding protein [Alicyclobacillus sp. SO9]|uniref:ABC transporter ATP-binding protein n=1 Tax=Alicyclobacillus sp. SO9 TaxID=2665646 RepID=UPI0018E7C7A4|nr:ABC transporter ATP-binding protein [Alicyclobacillus sp. SO9]QQE78202.1 ABC transporter ATP-binding protein [Alicyclobacillus sp. SO9]